MRGLKVEKLVFSKGSEELEKTVRGFLEGLPREEWYSQVVNLMKLFRGDDKFLHRSCFKDFIKALSRIFEEPEGVFLENLVFHGFLRSSSPLFRSDSDIKEIILSAALEIFSKKGYHEATIDEIARRAGVAKGSIYRYFPSKEDLFKSLLESRLEALSEKIRVIVNSDDHIIDIIKNSIRVYMEFFDENRGFYELLFREKSLFEAKEYTRRALKHLAPLKKKIFKATSEGYFKPINFQAVFYGFMGFIHGIIQKWIDSGCSYSLCDEVPMILEVLFYGTVAPEYRLLEERRKNGQGSHQAKDC